MIHWLLVLKIILLLLLALRFHLTTVKNRKHNRIRRQRPIVLKAGFWVNFFPELISQLTLVLTGLSFFEIGVLGIATKWHFIPRLSGLLIFIIGWGIENQAIKTLGTNYSPDLHIRKGQELIRAGVYRFVRHPYYLGTILCQIGMALTLLSYPGFGLTFAALIPALSYRIRAEEKLLIRYFQNEYKIYQNRTGRILPGLI
ncbi:isoprenylcysteine carboxylmethyltransferase family protein [candidate division KSB1 bacterium]|nr:isoprenylcysteine carboxylmethyltransferase family protein [candidate division KSB1 bacterium]